MVGGGPAGVSAALQARELGADVALLEADRVGGTNLNRGPGPVRTLARAARLAREWSSWERFGLEGPRPVPNLDAILANCIRVARYAHDKKDVAGLLRRSGIELDEQLGLVRFADPYSVRAGDGRSWRADRIVIAVGCRAAADDLAHDGHLRKARANVVVQIGRNPRSDSLQFQQAQHSGAVEPVRQRYRAEDQQQPEPPALPKRR